MPACHSLAQLSARARRTLRVPLALLVLLACGCFNNPASQPVAAGPESSPPQPAKEERESATATDETLEPLALIVPDRRSVIAQLRGDGAEFRRNSHGNAVAVSLKDGSQGEALELIAQLQYVTSLAAPGLQADAAAWQSLVAVGKLEEVSLPHAQLSPAAWEVLSQFPKLRSLALSGSSIRSAQIAKLRPLTQLAALDLSWTKVDGDAARELAELPVLAELDLSFTAVGDQDLLSLAKSGRLRMLKVEGTDVTAQGIATLKEKLPELEVIGGPPEPAGR